MTFTQATAHVHRRSRRLFPPQPPTTPNLNPMKTQPKTPPPANPPNEKTPSPDPSLEDSIVGFFKVLGDSYIGSLKLQNANAELQNAMSNYRLVSDKVKLHYLKSLVRTS